MIDLVTLTFLKSMAHVGLIVLTLYGNYTGVMSFEPHLGLQFK